MPLTVGSRLGPYEMLAPLGAGGMGEVYRALDPRLGREVAVKVLPEAVAKDPERLRRFEKEARAVGALNHPNILTVHDVGTHDGSPYVVTELLEGETLREVLVRRAPTTRQVLSWAVQAAQGLCGRAPEGDRPQRHQAREPLPDDRRPRQDPRLRPGQADAAGRSRRPLRRKHPRLPGRRMPG